MLQIVVHEVTGSRPLTGLCAGYEVKEWRANALADHLMESLPAFCLTYSEYKRLDHSSAIKLIRQAAQSVYKTDKFKLRGEFGELLLHVILKSTMGTIPAVSKIYYKDSSNDTVKGFDAVHVVPTNSGLELWLGEVKFYDDHARAIRDVVVELEAHLKADYLKSEFVAIVNKIDDGWPFANDLKKLLDAKTSLDEVFKAFCIPVLLTYDSETTASHEAFTDAYKGELAGEFRKIAALFSERVGQVPHKIHLFLVPLNTKKALIEALDKKLKAWQGI